MKRLIFVPQYPTPMRYPSWWIDQFPMELSSNYEVITLGKRHLFKTRLTRTELNMFSPINNAIDFETVQINEYMNLDLHDDDTLLLADISFPGVFCNVLYHKPCPKMYAYCHATSKNKYDYFAPVRHSKFMAETAHSKLFDGIFVGSEYHQNKLGWNNTHVVTLPDSPDNIIKPSNNQIRPIDIISVCRTSIQKVNKKLEKKVEKELGIKIHREEVNTWSDYNILLSNSKVMISSSKEDTFNLTILDVIKCGCVPMVPDSLCFPEILSAEWRYKDTYDLINKLSYMFENNHFVVPDIICRDKVDNFYSNIIEIMMGD